MHLLEAETARQGRFRTSILARERRAPEHERGGFDEQVRLRVYPEGDLAFLRDDAHLGRKRLQPVRIGLCLHDISRMPFDRGLPGITERFGLAWHPLGDQEAE